MIPTETTSIGKIAAAIGVPNSEENTALMPTIIMVFLSDSLNRNSFPMLFPILPPSCSAAPSRPTEAPTRCEKIVFWGVKIDYIEEKRGLFQ